MTYQHIYNTIDTSTAGEPTRIVIAGVPFLNGDTMSEKQRQLHEEYDFIRTILMHEPRGHASMFGAIITAPVNPQAHLGVVFMDCGGYLAMCIHGTIGMVTALIEMGLVPRREPETHVIMDTPAGLVQARARIKGGRVYQVAVENVPAYLLYSKAKLEVPTLGSITADIAFGGNFFALVDAAQLGLQIRPECLPELIHKGMAIRLAANEQLNIQHPTQPHIRTIDLVEIYEDWRGPEMGHRNVVIFGQGQVDRSPCGTGTCAKMAVLHANNRLSLEQEFVSESILGMRFTGRLLRQERVGPVLSVVPEIVGTANLTGFQQFVVETDDPLGTGFLLPQVF